MQTIALPGLQSFGGRLSPTIHAEDTHRDGTVTPMEEIPPLYIDMTNVKQFKYVN